MRKTHVTIVLSLLLILAALLLQRWAGGTREGFQAATLPTGTQTVTDFVIYASLNKIMDKLPFLHTNFTEFNAYPINGLTTPLTMMPTTVTPTRTDLRLIAGDGVEKLYSFKLKSAITGPIDQTAVEALNNASSALFDGPGKIAFKTMNGNLYPSIVLPATAAPAPTPATPPATPTTLTDGFYKSDATTDTTLYYIKTVAGTTTKYTVNTATVNTAACGKTVPTTGTTTTAASLAAITTSQVATCADLP